MLMLLNVKLKKTKQLSSIIITPKSAHNTKKANVVVAKRAV